MNLRHRNEIPTSGLSSSITKSSRSRFGSTAGRIKRSTTSRTIRSWEYMLIIIFGSIICIYFFAAVSFVKDTHTRQEKPRTQIVRRKIRHAGPGGDLQSTGRGRDETETATYSLYTQHHVSVPLPELLPALQSLKERYRSTINKSVRGSNTQQMSDHRRRNKKIFKAYDRENAVQLNKKFDKKGNLVYNPITSIQREDLGTMLGISPQEVKALSNITYEQASAGREQLVEILNEAGIVDIDPIAIHKLPSWSSVTKLYGEKPVILGLERCEEFRTNFPLDDASIGTAGMFNTGTNPFAMYVSENCKLPKNTHDKAGGTRWQVPWGKHMLAERRWTNTAGHDHKTNKTNVMPIVLVRDPFTWMQSMCKHQYEARWPHQYGKLCPNLAKTKLLSNGRPDMIPLKVRYKPPADFKSLAHYWGEWYKQYLEADYPRLIVRFEDIHFHAKEMIETVCECAGGVARNEDATFRFVVDSAKWGAAHKSETNMISAMIKYGSDDNRFTGMTEADYMVTQEVFTPALMELFGYEMPQRLHAP